MWVETYMTGSGLMIRQMAMGSTYMQMGPNMMESGEMIFRRAKVSKHGLMDPSTMVRQDISHRSLQVA